MMSGNCRGALRLLVKKAMHRKAVANTDSATINATNIRVCIGMGTRCLMPIFLPETAVFLPPASREIS